MEGEVDGRVGGGAVKWIGESVGGSVCGWASGLVDGWLRSGNDAVEQFQELETSHISPTQD